MNKTSKNRNMKFKARARIPPGLFMGLSLCGAWVWFLFSFCDQILCEKPACEDRFQILFISCKIQPGASKKLPKWSQKGPTWTPKGPKWSPKGATLTKRATKVDQRRSARGRLPEFGVVPFWSLFGRKGRPRDRFWRSFWCLFPSKMRSKIYTEIEPQKNMNKHEQIIETTMRKTMNNPYIFHEKSACKICKCLVFPLQEIDSVCNSLMVTV